VPGVAAAAVAGLVFLPALRGEFLSWDDEANFVLNPHYRGLGWAQLRWMFTTAHLGPYIPVTWLTLGLDYLLWGLDPWGYHLTSLLFHGANAWLAYLVSRRLLAAGFGAAGRRAEQDPAVAAGALLAALAFAVHPLRVESVAWVTERRDVVSGFLALVAVLAYLRSCARGTPHGLHRGWLWASALLFALALLAKATVAGLPVALLALDAYPLGRGPGQAGGWGRWLLRRGVVEKAPFWAASVALAGVALATGAGRGILAPLEMVGVGDRLALVGHALAFYLEKTLVPSGLSPMYTLYLPVPWWTPAYLARGAAALAITVVLVAVARRWPAGLVAWVAYLALLLPVSGLFHNGLQAAADRHTYLPTLGVAVLAGAALASGWRAARDGRLARGVAVAALGTAVLVVLGLAALTSRQVGVWRDSVTLWRHAAAVEPESDIPMFFLGWALARAGRLDEARAHFLASLDRVRPGDMRLRAQVLLHLGVVEEQRGDLGAAAGRLAGALGVDPGHPVAWIRLGGVLHRQGDAARARAALERAAGLGPEWSRYKIWELREAIEALPAPLARERGDLTFHLGLVLQRYGDLDEAREAYQQAVAVAPDHGPAWNNLGVTLALQGRNAEALGAFTHALRARPADAQACANARRAAAMLGAAPPELEQCRAGG
jgi:tetratricopeptide (TPR) repeat protein